LDSSGEKNPSAGLYLHVSALVGEVARRHPNGSAGPVAPLLGMSLRRMLGMEASTREIMINSGIPW